MSPFTEGDIPMEGGDEDDLPPLPNGVINVEAQEDSGDDFSSDQSEGEEDEDAEGYTGYQLLSQDAESENSPEDINPSHENASGAQVELPSHLANMTPIQSVPPDPATCVSYRDTQGQRESRKQGMAADDQIKLAMTGIMLPQSSVPSWASALDEDEWNRMLQRQIKETPRTDGDRQKEEQDNSKR